jgi:hypothetical protein
MSEYAYYRQIADELLAQGNRSAAEALDTLLTNYSQASTSAHETRQQVVKQGKRISELEEQLQMAQGIRYQEMRLELPEGGHVSLRWPESMTSESADMLREVFELQMKAHARYMMNRAKPPEEDAAAQPVSGGKS